MFQKLAVVILVLFATTFASGPSAKQSITVKLMNGKTGRAVWWRGNPYVFVGQAIYKVPIELESASKTTNFFGEVKVDVTGAEPPEVKVWVDFISRDCRFDETQQPRLFTYSGSTMTALPTYSIQQILKTGIVSDNHCAQDKVKPKPGVLLIYVVPATLKELWDS